MSEITLEQVDKVRERTNVTYQEAKAALEAAGGDMLEAIILLERQGRVGQSGGQNRAADGGFYSTRAGGSAAAGDAPPDDGPHAETRVQDILRTFWSILRHCTTNEFEIWRNGRLLTAMPVLAFLLLLVFAMWVTGPLLLFGLLCGCRYRFSGPELGGDPVNAAMEKLHDVVDEAVIKVKDEFKGGGTRGKDSSD